MPASSSLSTQCPECGATFKLKDDSAVGKKIKCRNCEAAFVVQPIGNGHKGVNGQKSGNGHKPGNGRKAKAEEEPVEDLFDDLGGERLQSLPPRRLPHPTKKKKVEKPEPVPGDELEEVRQKTLKGEPKRKRQGVSPALIGAAAVVGLGLLGLLVMVIRAGGGSSINPNPTYSEFQDKVVHGFKIDYPSDWTAQGGGQTGSVIWARFEKDSAGVRIKSSMGAGAIGGAASAFSTGEELDESLTPVAQVHDFLRESYAQDYSDYQELSTYTVQGGMGDVRVSEFTATQGIFRTKMHGFRASLLGGLYQWTIIAKCPESDWAVCKPIFEHMIKSMRG